MNKLKELMDKWEQFDVPASTETFKKHNPKYLKFVDSNFGRDEEGQLKSFLKDWGNDLKNLKKLILSK
jgi:hypothetical protein